jgi:hypothetical protein
MHPLTHHEIVGLVGPFARRGRHVDLAASDRMARRLVFRPVEHAPEVAALPEYRELLQLDSATPGVHRLTRTLTLVDGVQATLIAEGPDPDVLLARIEAVPHTLQLRPGPGFTIANSHRLQDANTPQFVRGTVRVAGLTVVLDRGSADDRYGELAMTTTLDDPLVLPDDLVAVLGWDWTRLDAWTDRMARRWTAGVRLRGRGTAASRDAEGKLDRVATLLATTLSEPPARFHERQRAARWLFAFRRSIPLQVCAFLILGALLFTKAGLSQDSAIRMLIFNAPPLMLVALFCLREPPRIEWPTWPRRPTATSWRSMPMDR